MSSSTKLQKNPSFSRPFDVWLTLTDCEIRKRQECQLNQHSSKASDNGFSMAFTILTTVSACEKRTCQASQEKILAELPRKSIQGYLAMYPRINGKVSKDTCPSNLASFFRLACL